MDQLACGIRAGGAWIPNLTMIVYRPLSNRLRHTNDYIAIIVG